MMRIFAIVAAMIFAAGCFAGSAAQSHAQEAGQQARPSTPRGLTAEEFSAQSRQVLRRRVPVYRRALGPNSVRVCNDYYVQEHRPSGTVITPRMNCYWRS